MKKIRTQMITHMATREFTDREEPRAAFWKEYEAVKAEILSGECNVHVLTYYGIGGIGKTSLLKKIMEEMTARVHKPVYAYIDFENGQERRKTLERLKNKLEEQGKFTFPLFDLGLYVYAKKNGERVDSPEVQQLTDRSPFLRLILSFADNIPVVSIASKVLALADQSIAFLRNHLERHSRELTAIEYMEPEELYKHLPMLFSLDMANNMKNATTPVVILLDTYERLVNELSQIGEPLKNDEWIRGEEGIVQNIPGVLWVIAGREKLKWVRFDKEWEDSLKQHILGNLSVTDSMQFLEKAGVGGVDLREGLYRLTQGTPVYLDLCVDQFTRILDQGGVPELSMFGKDTYDLIERFLRYMDDAHKDHIYLLSCLRTWNDRLISEIVGTVLPNFSLSAYEKTKDFSFVIQSGDGAFNIHQTIGDVLMGWCPASIKVRTGKTLIDSFFDAIGEDRALSSEFVDALAYVTRGALLLHQDRDDLSEFFCDRLIQPLRRLCIAGRFEQIKPILEMLMNRAGENTGDRLYGEVLFLHALFNRFAGNYTKGRDLAEEAENLLIQLLGPDHASTLRTAVELISNLHALGKSEEALPRAQETLERSTQSLGQDHFTTLSAMNVLSGIFVASKQYEEALTLRQVILETCRRVHGEEEQITISAMGNVAASLHLLKRYPEALKMWEELDVKTNALLDKDHAVTLALMNNRANTLAKMGRQDEALDLRRQALERRSALLGTDHPSTLITMGNLASSLEDLEQFDEAVSLRRAVVDKRHDFYGDDHVDTISAMNNLACTFRQMRRYGDELEIWQRALDACRKVYGQDHEKTLNIMEYIAQTLENMDEYEQAVDMRRKILDKRQDLSGRDDPITIYAMRSLVKTLEMAGEYPELLQWQRTILDICRRVYGPKDVLTVQPLEELADTLTYMDEHEEALALRQEVLDICRGSHGEDHPDTLSAMHNTAVCFVRLKDYEVAKNLLEATVEKRTRILGEAHWKTIQSMQALDSVLFTLGDTTQAHIYPFWHRNPWEKFRND